MVHGMNRARALLVMILTGLVAGQVVAQESAPSTDANAAPQLRADDTKPRSASPDANAAVEKARSASLDANAAVEKARSASPDADAAVEKARSASLDANAAVEKNRADDGKVESAKEPRGRIRFQFDGASYKDVIRRFAQIAGKPIIGDYNVPGTLTFYDSRKYSFDEAFDTLNTIMEMQGYALVEEERWFRLVELTNIGAKSKILKGLDTSDAKKLRESQIVTVVLPLKFLDAGTASKAIVRWVSSWGSISVLPKGKGLIITDRLSKIKRIRDLLKMLDTQSLVERQMKSYPLENASAKTVTEMIGKLFGSGKRRVYNPQTRQYEVQNTPSAVTAVSDERTNSILLLGAGDKLAMAEELIKKLDIKGGVESGDIRIFALEKAQAEDVAKTINAVIQGTAKKVRGKKKPVIRKDVRVVADTATNRLVVSAPVNEMDAVADLIERLDKATTISGGAQIFTLKHADAEQLSGVIANAVSKRDSRGRRISDVSVSVDPRNNALIIAGPGGSIEMAASLIERLDVETKVEAREVHVVTLKSGDASTIARALQTTFSRQTRDSRGRARSTSTLRVSATRGSNTLIISATPTEWPHVQEVLEKIKASTEDVATPTTKLIPLQHAKAGEMVRTLQSLYGGGRRSRYSRGSSTKAPVTITASERNNSLLVSAADDDQKAIAQLVESLDVPSTEKVEPFVMIRLESAKAEDLVTKISAMLPRSRRGDPEDVFIEPDKLTNSILLRAPESKREMIEKIVAKLDTATQQEARETKTVPLKHTSAAAMTEVLTQMFPGGSSSTRRSRWGRRRSTSATDPGGVTITPAPGDKMLVIDAPRSKMKEITSLIATLDTDESGGQVEVRTYQLTNSDAREIARSLQRLFGSTRSRRGRGQSTTGEPDPRFEADSGTNQVLIAATEGQFEDIEPLIEKLTKSAAVAMKARLFKLQYVKAEDMVPVLETTLSAAPSGGRRGRRGGGGGGTVRISTMKLANTIVLQAPPAKVALAEELIKSFDTEDSGLQTTIEIVPLVNAQADTLAQTVSAVLTRGGGSSRRRRWNAPADTDGVSITAETNSNSVIARGPGTEVAEAVEMIRKIDADAASMTVATRTFKLEFAKAGDLAPILQELVTGEQSQARSRWGRRRGSSSGGAKVTITAVKAANSIVVKAPQEQMALAETLIKQFDREDAGTNTDVQIVKLANAEAASLAEAVNQTLAGEGGSSRSRWGRRSPQTSEGGVTVIPESNSNSLLVRGPKTQVPEVVAMIERLDGESTTLASQTRTFKLKFIKVDDMLPVLESLTQSTNIRSRWSRRSASSTGQVRIASMKAANTIIVQGPPDKLAMAEELVRTFDVEDSTAQTAIEMVQLEHAEADSLADSVNAILRKQSGGGRPRRGRGSEPAGDTAMVTPESNSNSLLVRGPAGEVPTVVEMIRKLDADAGAVTSETKTFKLQFAKASDLVEMLEEMLSGQSTSRSRWGRRGGASAGKKDIRISKVSGANAIVVKAPPAELSLAEALIKEFDSEESGAQAKVELVRLQHAQAESLAESVNATISGQGTGPSRRRRGGSSGGDGDKVVVIAETNSNSVLVRGPGARVGEVVTMVKEIDAEAGGMTMTTRTFRLQHAKASDLVPVLQEVVTGQQQTRSRWGRRSRGSSQAQITISAVAAANAIVVKAPKKEMTLAETLIEQFDAADSGATPAVEIVRLTNADASSLAEAVNATLSGQGSRRSRWGRGSSGDDDETVTVIAETNSNSVLVRGPRGEVPAVVEMVRSLDADATTLAIQTRTFQLKHAKAADIVAVLEPMLTGSSGGRSRYRRAPMTRGTARVVAMSSTNSVVVQGTPEKLALADQLIQQFDSKDQADSTIRIVRLEKAQADSLAAGVSEALGQKGGRYRRGSSGETSVTVTPETNSNSVLVRGPASLVEETVAMIRKLDEESTGGDVEVRVYPLANSQAGELADSIGTLFRDIIRQQTRGRRKAPSVPFSVTADTRTNSLVVSTTSAHFALVEDILSRLDKEEKAERDVEYVWLDNADAATVAEQLEGMFKPRRAQDRPVIEPDYFTNALTLIGKDADLKAMMQIVEKLDNAAKDNNVRVRVVTLKDTRAEKMAQLIRQVYSQMTESEIVITDKLPDRKSKKDNGDEGSPITLPHFAPDPNAPDDANVPADPAESELGKEKILDVSRPRVTIAVDKRTNALVISATRRELDNIESLINQLATSEGAIEAELKVFKVAQADPLTVAETIDKLFNPVQPKQKPQRKKGEPAPAPYKPDVTVVPDVRTKSVIVRAKPRDLELIEPLIQRLDQVSTVVSEVRIFKVKNTDAEAVAENLRELFRLSGQDGQAPRGKSPRGRKPTPTQQRAETIRQVIELKRADGVARVDTATQVSVSANTKTNSVVVAAPADAMGLIGGLIQELDQSAATALAAVRMYPLKHAEVKATVATLQEIFNATSPRQSRSRRGSKGQQEEPIVITGDARGGQVVVSAPVDKHELIAQVIADLDDAKSDDDLTVKVYRITHAQADGIASAIAASLEGASSGGGRRRRGGGDQEATLRISADSSSNAIVIRATGAEHEKIASLIEQMDVAPNAETTVHTIQLTKGEPAAIAETLTRLFAGGGSSPSRRGRRATTPSKGVLIEADESSRTLMVRADEETFERIRSLAVKLDTEATGGLTRTILPIENGNAVTIASSLSQAFAPQRGRRRGGGSDETVNIVAEPASNSVIVTANQRDLEKVKALLAKLDSEAVEGTRTEYIVLKHAKSADLAEVLSAVAGGSGSSPRRGRRSGDTSADGVTVTSDAASNALVLSGPSKELDRLMAMALQLDSAAEGKTVPVFKTYPIKNADVNSLVTALQKVFQSDSGSRRRRGRSGDTPEVPVVIVADEPGSRVVVSASKKKHELVAEIMKDLDSESTGNQVVVRVYKLKHGEARSLGWTLQQAWQKQQRAKSTTDQTRIAGDSSSNSIVVRATERDQSQIAKLIDEMDAPADVTFPIKAIPLNDADPDEVARVLQSVFQAAGGRGRGGWGVKKQTIVIEASQDSRMIMVRADEKTFDKVRELAAQLDKETSGKATRTILTLENAQADSVASALSRAFQPKRGQKLTADEQVAVVAESASNSLIVTANEDNLTRVKGLLAQLDKEGSRRTEFLLLQHAKARELAEVLTKAAGGTSSSQRGRRGGSAAEGVVVTADSGSNALVMAGPTNEVDKLMKMALQLDQATEGVGTGVYIIGLDNSDARDMAVMVENLYRSQAQAAKEERKSIDPLGVSADERANAIVLATTKAMFEKVSTWVNEVESLKPERGKARIISLENADPAEVEKVIQQMLEKGGSMQVRDRGNRRGRRGGSNTSSGSGRVNTTVLEKQRSIMVDASDEDFAEILKVVQALDKAAADRKKSVEIYNLKNATNTQVATALGQVYRVTRDTPLKDQVTVTSLRDTNAVVVSAGKEKHTEVARLIKELDKKEVSPQAEIRIYPLTNAQPDKIVASLRAMLKQVVRTKQGETIDVQADTRTKSIIVTAKSDVFDQVSKVIELLDKKPAYAQAQVLIVPLKRADAEQLAKVLNEMLRPSATQQVTPEARSLQEQVRLLRVRSTIKAKIPELDLTKPIKITADPAKPQGSNALVLTSTEDNLKALREIVGVLDTVPVTEGTRVRLIHLKNADAEAVEGILKDIFTQGQRLAGRQGTSVQGKAEPKSTSGRGLVNPLNVSADPRTNTVVLSGLEESIALAEAIVNDLDQFKGRILTDVKAFQLENADARQIGSMLQAAFTENPDTQLAGARTYVSRLRMKINEELSRTSRIPKNRSPLTIQADPTTNIILVAARSDVMPLIAQAIETLDVRGPGGSAAVRVVPLTNADASRVATVIGQLANGSTSWSQRPWDKPSVAVDTRTNSLVISTSDRTHAVLDAVIRKLDGKQDVDVRDIQLIQLENAEAPALADTLQKMMDARVQRQEALGVKDAEALRVIVLADPRSNSLVVGGSRESFAMVKELARRMDKSPTDLSGKIQVFGLTEANAGTLATTLQNLFDRRYAAARTQDVARQKPIILPDLRTNSLMVAANKDDTKVLTGLLKKVDVKLDDPAVRLTVIPLVHNDATSVGPMIQNIFQARLESMTAQGQTPSPQDRVDVATDPLSNALIVSASKENLGLINDLLSKVDVEPEAKTGVVHMYPLRNASASRVAGLLRSLIDQGLYKPGMAAAGDNAARQAMEKIAIEVDTRTNVLIVSASKQNFKVIEEIIRKIDGEEDYLTGGGIRTFALESADATKLAPTLQDFFARKRQAEITAGGSDQILPSTIIADARTNTLIVAAGKESFDAIGSMVKQLDRKEAAKTTGFSVFPLEHATAATLQDTLRKLFDGRVDRGDTTETVTVLSDRKTNSLIVAAAGDDMKLAGELIGKLDVEDRTDGESMQIFPLGKADASQVSQTLKELYPARDGTEQINVTIDERINAVIVTAGANDMKRIKTLVTKLDQPKVTRVTEIRVFTLKNAEAEELAEILTQTLTQKPKAMTARSPNLQNLLQFVSKTKEGKKLITSALQQGVLITADPRTNSLIVSASVDSMPLLATLITSLDSTSPRVAEIQVFKLKNADCRSMADVLVQLFKLQAGGGTTAKSVRYTLVTPATEAQPNSEVEGDGASATLGTADKHALSVTVDVRTNSLLVGGTNQYVKLASEVIQELDASPAQERQTKIYRLRNAKASDIEGTLQNFLDSERQRLQSTLGEERMVAAQRLLEREVTVVAEETTNTLLLSASPRYFKTIADLIKELDEPPPQVLIQVLLAEITLDDETDIGFDWDYEGESGSRTYKASTNFGVEAGIDTAGGFNLSVTGSDLSFFFRALKSQGRLNVLQRPQIVAVDNQAAEIRVGQRVPFITNSRITDNGDTINTVQYQDVSIGLSVTPRINPDGFVKLDVDQKIESLSTSSVEITEGVNAVIVNSRQATTTVTVQNGHTILIGGLITTEVEDRESKVPVLGDVPLVGNLFKSVTKNKKRTELLIVLTPRVLRTAEDADRVTDPQVQRMNYLRKLNSGQLNEAAFELLEEGDPTLDANPNDPVEPEARPKAERLPDPVKVPVEMLPELYRLHKELEARRRAAEGQGPEVHDGPSATDPETTSDTNSTGDGDPAERETSAK
ncbi:MAG: secretin N-terminal domain-containing protein [Planctomycetota bacterium]